MSRRVVNSNSNNAHHRRYQIYVFSSSSSVVWFERTNAVVYITTFLLYTPVMCFLFFYTCMINFSSKQTVAKEFVNAFFSSRLHGIERNKTSLSFTRLVNFD